MSWNKLWLVFILVVNLVFSGTSFAEEIPLKDHPVIDVYDGWNLGLQAYTFREYTFFEAVDKTAALGIGFIEAYPLQELCPDKPGVKFHHTMGSELRKLVRDKLDSVGVKLIDYGAVWLTEDEKQCRQVFDFAKEMGIETLLSDVPFEALDLVEKLCEEYKIKVALHNHPKPARYWNPDAALKACEGRSKLIGACGDTGHWMRSGLDPVECLKKLEGRIICLNFKDLNRLGDPNAHDVVWGTGKGDVKAMLTELDRQGFRGVLSVEYEYDWTDSMPEIRECIRYYNKIASGLRPTGWRELLEPDLSNCVYKQGSWKVEDGELIGTDWGDVWTKERYGDFILDLEFKLDKGTNSGVFIRTGSIEEWLHTAIEVQIHESSDGTKHGSCGAIYDCLSPSKQMVKPPGQWNRYTITCKANKIYVILNGVQIIDMDLDLWTEAGKNPDGTPNKFKTAYKDMSREGHIGFQYHGQPIRFRNIRIKPL